MEALGKVVVLFILVGMGGEVLTAHVLKEGDLVHAEERIPESQAPERPLYTDSSTGTTHWVQSGLAQDRITVTQLKDGRIQVIVVGSVSPATLPRI